ncbi:RHS repeat-associated core domain-containing protein, partial [Burkholderia ubonensis]|uniref:RHS repeat-associated core domain-containing protein n=1 Tax=Burkholderia ubonensis TaxID=101571 RepID=UPI000A63F147
TGLYDYGWRSYQPWLGRWLNPDPAGIVDGLNLFRMVRDDPTTLCDPSGTQPTRPKGFVPKRDRKGEVVNIQRMLDDNANLPAVHYVNSIASLPRAASTPGSQRWASENNCASCTAAGAVSLIKLSHSASNSGLPSDYVSHENYNFDFQLGDNIAEQASNIISFVRKETGYFTKILPSTFSNAQAEDAWTSVDEAHSWMRAQPNGAIFAVLISGAIPRVNVTTTHWLNAALAPNGSIVYIDFQSNRGTPLNPRTGGRRVPFYNRSAGPSTSVSPFAGIIEQNEGDGNLHGADQLGTFDSSARIAVVSFSREDCELGMGGSLKK